MRRTRRWEAHECRREGALRVARRRVLIADDDPLIRTDLAEMLTEAGFEVVGQVGDGERAVEQARKLRPDLVLLDIKMPGIGGIQAAAEIAAAQIAPVIILTAYFELGPGPASTRRRRHDLPGQNRSPKRRCCPRSN